MTGTKRRRILYGLTILWVCAIWMQSALPGSVSGGESGRVLQLLQSIWNSIGLPFPVGEYLVRKTAHFTEYCVLGLLLRGALFDRTPVNRRLIGAALCVWIPFVDETIQLFSPNREGKVPDMWIDVCGCLFGWLLLSLLLCALHNAKKDKTGNVSSQKSKK